MKAEESVWYARAVWSGVVFLRTPRYGFGKTRQQRCRERTGSERLFPRLVFADNHPGRAKEPGSRGEGR
jgi:hypothetical protein